MGGVLFVCFLFTFSWWASRENEKKLFCVFVDFRGREGRKEWRE